jgi:3-oxoacyl-[acyl-carrier protein] reductase
MFAEEGASLILCSRTNEVDNVAAQIRAVGCKVASYRVDVSQTADVQRMVKDGLSHFDNIDILVNNAGIYGPIGALWKNDQASWMNTVAVNLFGTVNCITSVLPYMIERRKGKIINLAGGGEGPFPRFSAYACSKSAVVRLTETLAEELIEYNIDINSIAPGPVNTRLLDEVLAAGVEAAGFYEKALKQKKEGGVSADRAAELAVFLASDASDKITGRLLSAIWDDWRSIKASSLAGRALYQMRRIDDQRFKEV